MAFSQAGAAADIVEIKLGARATFGLCALVLADCVGRWRKFDTGKGEDGEAENKSGEQKFHGGSSEI